MKKTHYETTVILKPEGGMDTLKQFADKIDEIVTKMEGKIVDLNSWGEKKLAYEIKKNLKGHYLFMNYIADGKAVEELERNFNIWEHVLKFMTIKVDHKESVQEMWDNAKGIASLFEKSTKYEEKQAEKEKTKSEKKESTDKKDYEDNRDYQDKLQQTFSKSKEDEEDENVEL